MPRNGPYVNLPAERVQEQFAHHRPDHPRPETHALRPGSVAVNPAGVPHSLEASADSELEFVIFGTPPMSIEDERAKPRKG